MTKAKGPKPIIVKEPEFHDSVECRSLTVFECLRSFFRLRLWQNISFEGKFRNAAITIKDKYGIYDITLTANPQMLRQLAKDCLTAADKLEEFRKRPVKVIKDEEPKPLKFDS